MTTDTKRKIVSANYLEGWSGLVFTNGCFDLLHCGHVDYLEQAAQLGECLCVAVNSDASVRALKGSSRPLLPLADRMRMVASLACVDYVFPFDSTTVENLLLQLKPFWWVKGGDYTLETLHQGEVAAARRVGAKIQLLPFLSLHSTSSLIRRIKSQAGA